MFLGPALGTLGLKGMPVAKEKDYLHLWLGVNHVREWSDAAGRARPVTDMQARPENLWNSWSWGHPACWLIHETKTS